MGSSESSSIAMTGGLSAADSRGVEERGRISSLAAAAALSSWGGALNAAMGCSAVERVAEEGCERIVIWTCCELVLLFAAGGSEAMTELSRRGRLRVNESSASSMESRRKGDA